MAFVETFEELCICGGINCIKAFLANIKLNQLLPVVKRFPHTFYAKMPPKTKDPNAPKRAQSAYFHFLRENRERISDAIDSKRATDVTKKAAEEWKALKDKSKWEEMAAQDKERYLTELDEYNMRGGKYARI